MKWKKFGKDISEDSKIIGYFHPKCAKRYFSNKEPIPLIKARHHKVKWILLHNLDKICLDPEGYLANIEYLKTDEAEEEYKKAKHSAYATEWRDRYMKLVTEGEEVDLEDFDHVDEYFEVKRELVKKIKSEIKQNPSEWKIEKGINYLVDQSRNQLVKHQPSGRRYWKIGISEMRGKDEWKVEGKQDWAEIEALINGSKIPEKINKPTDAELEKLKRIFQKNHIRKITYEKGQLFIEYDDVVNYAEAVKVNNQELQELKKYCQEHNEKEISKERFSNNDNSPTSSPDKGNQKLAIGLAIGAGAVLLAGTVVYLVRKRKNKHK